MAATAGALVSAGAGIGVDAVSGAELVGGTGGGDDATGHANSGVDDDSAAPKRERW